MAIKIDPNEDSRFYIFDYVIECRFPHLATLSPDYISHFGMPTTGDQNIDRALSEEWIHSFQPIVKMVEFHKDGIPVRIIHRADVKFIYEAVTNHLTRWKERVERGINLGKVPYNDLVELDEFASTVYPEAASMFDKQSVNSMLLRHMSEVMRINKTNFFVKPVIADEENVQRMEDGSVKINAAPAALYPKRESMSEIFKGRSVGRWS